MNTHYRTPKIVETLPALLLVGLASVWNPAAAQSPFPQFPAFDPFLNSVGTNGGSAYAPNTGMGAQTNAMGQIWFSIDSNGSAANAVTNTALSLSYQGLTGFSGNTVLIRNGGAGPGGRMFFQDSGTFPTIGAGTNLYYSAVIVVSNVSTLSTAGQYFMAFGTQSVIANQTSQPTQGASGLWIKQVNSTQYELGLSPLLSKSPVYYSTALSTNTVHLIVCDDEFPAGNVNLWIDPDPSTFGAATQPTGLVTGTGGNLTSISCAQIYAQASLANAMYLTDFRMGSNWTWVTGGPAVGFPLLASTNCANGQLNLSAIAMNNGSANTYNWQFNGNNLGNGPSISGSGATVSGSQTPNLTITGMDTSATQLDAGSYTIVVSNTWGAVTSSVCAVTADAAPVITTQPNPTSLMLFAGQNYTVSLSAVGASLSYDWFSNNVAIPAVTGANFTVSSLQSSASIYCIVSNGIGTQQSVTVTLTAVSDPVAPYPSIVFSAHPIGFWPLNEGPDNTAGNDGTTAFDYMSGNNGYYTNADLDVTGYGPGLATQFGYSTPTDTAMAAQFGTFAGQNSYVAQIPNINFASAGSGGSSFSVEAWVNALNTPQTSGAAVVAKGYGGGGEQFDLDYNNGYRFLVREAGGTTVSGQSGVTYDGNWHHLVGVLDTGNSNLTLYVDGIARTNVIYTPSTGILSSTLPVTIGARMSSATSAFNDNFYGNIQDVAIYNYALTAAQVANHYYSAGVGPAVTVPNTVTVNEGGTLVIPGTVTGTPPLTNQWYDQNFGIPGSPIPGQTNATLVISNVSYAAYNGHSLALSASNTYGSAFSSQVFITVQSGAPTSVAVEPASLNLYQGLTATFTATGQGSIPFTYHWSTNGVNAAGATNSTYSPVLPPGTYTIGCAVANSFGAGTPAVATATYTVVPTPTDSYGSTIFAAGPVAFWRLDEPNGATTAFEYIGGHNAHYENALNGLTGFSPTNEPSETASEFGATGMTPSLAIETNDVVAGIPLIDFSSQGANAEFSVEAWINAPSNNTDFVAKGYPNNTQFAIDGGGTAGAFRFVVHNAAGTISTVNFGSVSPDGAWHHLVAVCDQSNGTITAYSDGVQKGGSSIAKNTGVLALSSTYPVVMGSGEAQGGNSFTGPTNCMMSQVALYSYALTSTEVAAHFAAANGLPTLSPFSITNTSVVRGTSVTLTWASVANHTYHVQATPALGGPTNSWSNLGAPIVATGTSTSYTDTSTNAMTTNTYYRVVGF